MSFDVKLYTSLSEENRLDKTLVDIGTYSGALRDNCSIINPVVLLEASLVDLTGANYCEIEAFGRKYFITDITSVRTNLVQLTCRVDVLSSFADEIRLNKGIVHRQQDEYNLYLNDGSLRVYGNPIVHTMSFPKGFDGYSYVLVVAGRRSGGLEFQGGIYLGEDEEGGTGNTDSKTTSGLIIYAEGQVGRPYWYGTYGQTASQSLFDFKYNQYPNQYTATDFPSQFGQKVHDCVGLVKGYRWCESPNAVPVPVAGQDVNVRGLFSQCNQGKGQLSDGLPIPGAIVFTSTLSHCGVYVGNGYVVEARGHQYGVQKNLLSSRTSFTQWGIPDWIQVTTQLET